jgi:hypothetical protein
LGDLQKIEKDEECSDIDNREGSGGWKGEKPIEKERVAIDRIEMRVNDLRRAHGRERTEYRCNK